MGLIVDGAIAELRGGKSFAAMQSAVVTAVIESQAEERFSNCPLAVVCSYK
ncbi:hypothetical protein [Primorskyibacter flagellatus]|uniref:hypothetical protein n=1 Tax=Primorskyibacter flagellatus TaxID=1387277 RepID=UPI0015C4B1D0|nr:hypothetical protein [Primorskyibacter flagellatus]